MRKGTNDLVLLKDGRNEITDEQSIAQEMNLYFSSVFTHEQSDLPEFDNMIYDNLSHILCTSSEVEKHLKALNIHKSPGPDLISPHILRWPTSITAKVSSQYRSIKKITFTFSLGH